MQTIDLLGPRTPGAAPRVLDVGCGDGMLLESLARRGFRGVGVDPSPAHVAAARERIARAGADNRLEARVGAVDLPPDGQYDVITVTDGLERHGDPRARLRAMRERLAPGGLLVVCTRNRRSLAGARRWIAERFPAARAGGGPATDGAWPSWTDLESHGAYAGLVAVSRRGIVFPPGGCDESTGAGGYGRPGVRRAELALSRTPLGRFGALICVGFRPL